MSFKEGIDFEKLWFLRNEFVDNFDAINEYGHVVIHSSEYESLKQRSIVLQNKIKEINEELNRFCEEITDWYGY